MKLATKVFQAFVVAVIGLTLSSCDHSERESKDTQTEPYQGPWEIEINQGEDGKFSSCTARNYSTDTGLYLTLMPNDVVDVGFIKREWNIPHGDVDVELTFDIESKMKIRGQGRGALLAIPIEQGRKFLQTIEKRLLVRVEIIGTENRMQFDLKDIEKIAPTLIQCVDDMTMQEKGS